jgi:hypothetical protein
MSYVFLPEGFVQKACLSQMQWHKPVILTTQEVESRRIVV